MAGNPAVPEFHGDDRAAPSTGVRTQLLSERPRQGYCGAKRKYGWETNNCPGKTSSDTNIGNNRYKYRY